MTRLTQYVSNELILKYFVPTIVQQSSSIAFQTRKVLFYLNKKNFSQMTNLFQSIRHVQQLLEIYQQLFHQHQSINIL